jgi:uncharacterized protein
MVRQRWDRLLEIVRKSNRILIAFSGGCDSAFLLATARRELGKESVLAVTAISPSLAERERKSAENLVRQLDVNHQFLNTEEMLNSNYSSNPSNRCFYCKDELFAKLAPIAIENKMVLADGYNASDRSDVRPGFSAAQIWNVQHPLDQADLDKRSIRILSRWMGLPTWNKPASPCLSSRIPYGTPVSESVLRQIEKAEEVLHLEGFSVARVRHYGPEARVEVPLEDLDRLNEARVWQKIEQRILASGYKTVVADPRGFKSGRLNIQ